MSVFLEANHLFLRNPRGGVEGIAEMKAAGFGAIFLNIGDYPTDDWNAIRERAAQNGVVCGPWLRTAEPSDQSVFSADRLLRLIEVADAWQSPYIVNAESELKDSGKELTSYINQMCGADDYALSMEPTPFANVEWWPIKAPVLPQCFGPDYGSPDATERVIDQWQGYGVNCVVPTFGTYNQWQPSLYPLLSPYGLYTADDCGNNYGPWKSKGTHTPCKETTPVPTPTPPPSGKIGKQHGIEAAMNRLRDLDPKGTTLLKQSNGEWPDISVLSDVPMDKWKAWDKLQRTLTILKDDHDAS